MRLGTQNEAVEVRADRAGGELEALDIERTADNIVQVHNHVDSSFKSEGKDQLNSIQGPNVGPKNEALAYSSCTNCDTLALAVQLDLTSLSPRNVQPFNYAKAENYGSTNAVTCAIAVQVVLEVPDPTAIPSDVRKEDAQLHSELANLPAAMPTGMPTSNARMATVVDCQATAALT